MASAAKRARKDAGAVEVVNPGSRFLESEIMDMFSIPPTISPVVEWVRDISYYPISSLDSSNSIIEFYISPSATELIRPSGIMLEVEFRVTLKDGVTQLGQNQEKDIGLSSFGLYSLFSNQQISLNEIVIDDSNNLHLHRCAVDILLNKSKENFDDELLLAGVYKNDIQKELDALDSTVQTNFQAGFKSVKPTTWIGPLITGLCKQKSLLPTNTSLRVKFTKAIQQHYFFTTTANRDKYKFVINKCRLIVPKVRLEQNTALAVETSLASKNIHYKIERYSSNYMTISKAIQNNVLDTFHIGLCPLFTVVTFVDSTAFSGTYGKNPVNYIISNLSHLKVCMEEESELRQGIRVTPENISEPMLALLRGTRRFGNPYMPTLAIKPEEFKKWYALFFFSHLKDPEVRMDAFHELKRGNMRFQVEWRETEDNKNVAVIFHMMFLSDLQITGDRRILYEFQ